MSKHFEVPVNLLNSPTDPIIGHEGDIYYNTTTNVIRLYKNGAWEDILASSTVEGSPGYYGAFHDTTTQNIVNTTTAYKITMNSTDESNGISRDVADTSKIRFAHAGTYSLTFSIQLINTNNSIQNANVWFKKGSGSGSSSDIPYSNSQTTVPNSHGGLAGQSILTVNLVATFAANDYVQLYWQGESTALSIETIAAGTTPTTPVTPSIIFTAVQVASVLTGGGGGSGATVLDDLTDVVQTDPADNEVLAYNSANNTWINQTATEAGLQAIVSGVTDTEIGYLDGVTSSIQTQIDGKISASSSDTLTNKIINLGTGITSIAAYDNISGFYGQNNIVILQSGIDRGGRINITSEGVITIANSGIGYTNGIVTTTGGTRLIITVGGNVITGTLAEFNAALTDADFATTGTTLSHYGITDAIDTSANSQTKTGDLTITGNLTVNGTTTTINSTAVNVNNQVIFEGSIPDNFETTLTTINPTADRTINLPDASGTLVLTASPTFTGSVTVATDIGSVGSSLQITNDTQTSIRSLTNSVVVAQSTGITLNAGGSGTANAWVFKNNGDLTFPDSSNQSTAFLGMSSYSTTNLSEGTRLYFTNERAVSALGTTLEDYLTKASASSTYLTQSSASSTYQPLDQDLTDIAALTGNGIIRRTSGTWGMDNNTYLTSSDVSGTYATISSLSSYLTTATAATTYQPTGDYLTSETDPVFVASEAYNITSTDTGNWDSAYGWGDHASVGYLTSSSLSGYATETYVSTGYQTKDQDLTDILALTGDGLLSRQSGVWSMDTTSYATTGDISSAVGDYIPLTQKGQDQGVAELDIDGFVPITQLPDLSATYSITSHNHTLDSLSNVVITGTPTDRQSILWDTTTSKWINETIPAAKGYGLLNATSNIPIGVNFDYSGSVSSIVVSINTNNYAYAVGDPVKLVNIYYAATANPITSGVVGTTVADLDYSASNSGSTTFNTGSTDLTVYPYQYFIATDNNGSGWVIGGQVTSSSPGTLDVSFYTVVEPTSFPAVSSSWTLERDLVTSPLPPEGPNPNKYATGTITSIDPGNSYTVENFQVSPSGTWESNTVSMSITGFFGATGPTGATGSIGATGSNGVNGIDGVNGVNGVDGVNGVNGADGVNGIDGIGYVRDSVHGFSASGYLSVGDEYDAYFGKYHAYQIGDKVKLTSISAGPNYYIEGTVTYTEDYIIAILIEYISDSGTWAAANDDFYVNLLILNSHTPVTISSPIQSTSPITGGLIVSGGLGVAKDVWIDGNLHVNGITETLHTYTIATSDNLIYLNAAHDSTITNAVGNGTYVTYTADNDYEAGMDIRVTGMSPSGYNISSGDLLTVDSATPTQFVVIKNTAGSFVSGGTAHAKYEANADLGFAGGYYDAGYAHAGLFRDASDGVFKFFDGYTPEPDEAVNIDTTHASFLFAPIKVESLDVVDASTTRTNLGLAIGMNVQAWSSNLAAISDGTYIGDDSITTVGTISDGTWNGNTINYSYGGTGLTTLGTAGQVLKVNSGATGLEWGTVDLSLYAPKASPTFTGIATIGEAVVKSTSTTITSSSDTTIASIPVGLGMVLAECVVLLSSTLDGSYYTSKILVRGDAYTADLTEYAIIENGSMNVTFTVVPGSNVLLKVATTNAGVKAKVISTYISAENGAA